jgi:flagellar biosynthesis protein FlhA
MKDNTLYVIAFSPRVETKLNSYIRENKQEVHSIAIFFKKV